jgi:FkbH-like protein
MTSSPVGSLGALLEVSKPADYHRSARLLLDSGHASLRPLTLGVVGSCTLQFLEPYLVVEGARAGLLATPVFGQFGQFEQELGNPASALLASQPDVVVLLLRPEDVAPDATTRGVDARPALEALVERLLGCVHMLRRHSAAPVLVANFATPALLPLGLFDANLPESLSLALGHANAQLRERLATVPGAFVWDYAGLVARHGSDNWTDRRLWALARVPVSAVMQPHLASHLTRTAAGVVRPPAKCLVLDLDNTLWGGAIGDDGVGGIQLGDEYPGSAYKAFQRVVRGLADRGFLLAVASKNERDVVDEVFREHTEMLLRPEDISAFRVNWLPKSGNLREIASELNIGVDALVFFDDNPIERAEVRANAPEVGVIEVPTDPLLYPKALLDSGYFDHPVVSAEDRTRGAMYRAHSQRQQLEAQAESVAEFLLGLEMVATVAPLTDAVLGRVAQLVDKTNQFNLTTKRHTQAELMARAQDPTRTVAWLRLRDRFGDQGLVAVGIVEARGTDAVVDTFLMSCRVMGRHAEQALLAFLVEHARRMGCTRLVADYVPTRKNGVVSDFYARHGLTLVAPPRETGVTTWCMDLTVNTVPWPDVILREDRADSDVGAVEATR